MNRFIHAGLLLVFVSLVACSNWPTQIPAQTQAHTSEPIKQPTITLEPIRSVRRSTNEPQHVTHFIQAPDRNLFQLARELWPNSADISNVAAETSKEKEYAAGHTEPFWLIDLSDTEIYQSDFTLELVTPNAYWYVENNLNVDIADLKRSAIRFEEDIYPAITDVFGTEEYRAINGKPRLNILNANLTNVAGYFSSTDQYPIDIRPKSNQRNIIYINAQDVPPGGNEYDLVLSHELQHVIHWNADASEDTWVNEGLSELASSIALKSTFSIRQFLRSGPISLVHWPTSQSDSLPNYGAASLFMHFFTEHYGGQDDLRDFLAQPEDGIAGIDRYLEKLNYEESFKDVFSQWATANILDEDLKTGSKIPGYDGLEVKATVSQSISATDEHRSAIPQYSVEYIQIKPLTEPFQLSFRGNTEVALLPVEMGPSGCWWSNSGDSIDSTLSYQIEIPAGSTALLEYEVWFDIEEYWDYVYIEVSVDGGTTWKIMETSETSSENPLGYAFGAGYTGSSGGWLTDSVELAAFAAEKLHVRFQYVTDDAVNAAGACFRNLSVSPARIFDSSDGWDARGFVFTNNVVDQDFLVQIITVGDEPRVRQLDLDSSNTGTWTVQPPEDNEDLIVAVGSMAEKTREFASYTLSTATLK